MKEDIKKQEAAKRKVETITKQWQEFSKTLAFQEFTDYMEYQDYAAIQAAKGPVYTFTEDGNEDFVFDREKAASLLQRSVMCDIVTTYVNGYVNPEALKK